jgi:hypothetical protein
MPSGEFYGTDGQCKVGKPVGDLKKSPPKETKEGDKERKMAKLTAWYRAKNGKDMTPKQIASVANRIGVPIPSGKSAEDVLQKMLPKGEKVVPVKSPSVQSA